MSRVFEDLHKHDGVGTVFPVCNESVSVWRKALEGVSVEKAAAVCSGGEVSFFSILPVVREQLQLIDHSYCSMYYAIGKHHAIEKLGAEAAHKLLTSGNANKLRPLFGEGNKDLPTTEAKSASRYSSYDSVFSLHLLRGAWRDISVESLKEFIANKDKLQFLHGDLNDLVDRGPFDLVYLSNAMDYAGRDRRKDYRVKDMVKPGGLVCYTHGHYTPKPPPVRGFEVVFSDKHVGGGSGNLSWTYNVAKAPDKEV